MGGDSQFLAGLICGGACVCVRVHVRGITASSHSMMQEEALKKKMVNHRPILKFKKKK